MSEMTDQNFVEYAVKAIVDNPDAVSTTREIDDRGVLITLSLAKEDMGKIIGKAGRTVSALRTLLRVIGSRNESPAEQRVNLKIYDPESLDGGATSPLLDANGDIDL